MTNTSRNIWRTILSETLHSWFAICIKITSAFALSRWIACCANANLSVHCHRHNWGLWVEWWVSRWYWYKQILADAMVSIYMNAQRIKGKSKVSHYKSRFSTEQNQQATANTCLHNFHSNSSASWNRRVLCATNSHVGSKLNPSPDSDYPHRSPLGNGHMDYLSCNPLRKVEL